MKKPLRLLAAILSVLLIPAIAVFAACSSDDGKAGTPVFTIDKTSVDLTVGGNVEVLTLNIVNVNETPEWTSSDPSVATVTVGSSANKATVKGVKDGAAVITARAGDNLAICAVTVKPGAYITLDKTSISLLAGTTATLSAETNVTTGLTYSSNNPSVATVSQTGLITAYAGGVAKITVSGGNASATCTVTVTAPYVMLNKELVLLTLEEGENTFQLEASSNGDVEWYSDNEDAVTVSDEGLVTAVAEGEAVITARYASASAECIVKVKGEILTVTILNAGEEVEDGIVLQPKNSLTLSAVVTPEQEGENANVTWSVVSGEEYVSVDNNGVVTSLGDIYGKAVIRATSVKDPDCTAEVTVTVPDPYDGWIKITDKNELIAALKSGNENVNMYLDADIDLDGATLNSTMGNFNATFDGKGYEIMNFTCNSGFFGGVDAKAVIKNLAITCTSGRSSEYNGLLGQFVLGKIENCRFDVTVNADNMSGLTHHVGDATVISNVILIVRNPYNKQNIHAGTFLGSVWQNSYCAVEGNVNTVYGPTRKTVDELKQASLYDGWDTEIWQIENGEIPVLKNGGNIGELRVILDKDNETLYEGGNLELTATVKPVKLSAADKGVIWESSNPSVATVDDNGIVTAIKAGTAVITATSVKDDAKYASCKITVVAPSGEAELELALKARSVARGGTYQIDFTASGGNVVWSSSNPSIATVNSSGVVTGIALGKTVITASIGTKTETMVIQVYERATGATEVSTAEQFKAIGNGTYYIVNDIDFGGDTVTALNEFTKIDGLGYTLSNFKTTKLFSQFQGTLMNVNLSCTFEQGNNFEGLFGLWISGTIENCKLDITFAGSGQTAIVHHDNNGTVKNVILVLTNSTSNADKYPVNFLADGLSKWENVYFVVQSGTVSGAAYGGTKKTEDQLKSADTFDGSWEEGWVIVDGELPVLKGALVTEPLKVKLDKTEVELFVGESETLTATVTPSELSSADRAVKWISDNPDVATVVNGVVTGLKGGTATIKAVSVSDETVYAECTVTVTAIALSINAEDRITELKLNAEKQLHATVNGGTYTWETSDNSVATVADGLVTAVGAGRVTITVRSENDPDVYDSITVEVKASVVITVTLSETTLSLDRDDTATITATVGNSDGGVSWTSSDETVATVVNGVITTHGKNGTATITATANEDDGTGNYTSATCTVTVTYVPVVITLDKNSYDLFLGGELSASDIATVNKGGLELSVVSGTAVSVSNGKIIATDEGTATVRLTSTVSYSDVTPVSKDVTVTVTIPQVQMSIDASRLALKVGETSAARILKVTMDVMPASPDASDIVWTSSDTSVISGVSGGYSDGAYTGTLNVAGEGKAVITATYTIGGADYKITCEVAAFTASGTWTAVYNLSTFKTVWSSGGGNYYLSRDLDLNGETVNKSRDDYNAVFDGRGFTVSNFVTKALFMYNNANSVIENVKLVCTLDNNAANEGVFGHHGNGGAIRNCYLDITFGTTLASISPALMNHINNAVYENILIVTHNPNAKSGVYADFWEAGGSVTNMICYRADGSVGSPKKGTDKTEVQLKSAATFEGWDGWVAEDGEYPRLATDFD